MAFINAVIEQMNPSLWKLTIYYSYYNLYNYTTIEAFSTLQEAKDYLLDARCYDKLSIVREDKK